MELLKGLVTLLVMPLLPKAYRRRWTWPCLLPDGPTQWFTSLLHVFLSAFAWALAFVAFQKAFGEEVAAAMWSTAEREGSVNVFAGWAGILGFFVFPLTLKGALAWTYLLDSVVRFIAMALHGDYLASVFFALPLWALEKARELQEFRRMNATYGKATEPDRLFEDGADIRIRAPRPHAEWHAQLTFHYRGQLYRLVSERDLPDGDRRCFESHFSPWPPEEIVRRVVLLAGEERPDSDPR